MTGYLTYKLDDTSGTDSKLDYSPFSSSFISLIYNDRVICAYLPFYPQFVHTLRTTQHGDRLKTGAAPS